MSISLVILQFRVIKAGLLALLMFYANCNLAADCTLDILLTSQAEIDEFTCDAGGTVVSGNLAIDDLVEYEIQNVNGLSGLTRVDGDLILRNNNALKTIESLIGIVEVGGDLIIQDHLQLRNIDGLSGLTRFEDSEILFFSPLKI